MKKIGVAFLILALIMGAAYVAFDRLGGNNPILVELVESPPPTLVGKHFKGQPQDEALGKTFRDIETLLSLNPGKKIHTIYYQEPGGKLDTMEVFVGLDLPFASAELETLSFKETKYLKATIRGNSWVMPGPNKVKAKLEESAKAQNLQLSGTFIDRIVNENEVQVLAPVR
jgi:hypothetical protein